MTTNNKTKQNESEYPKRIPTWAEVIGNENMFENCITTDLNEVEDAWTRLGKNKVFLQLLSLPAVVHYALRDTVEEALKKEPFRKIIQEALESASKSKSFRSSK